MNPKNILLNNYYLIFNMYELRLVAECKRKFISENLHLIGPVDKENLPEPSK